MNANMIDTAIQVHLDWISRFNAALRGDGPRDFDLGLARNDTTCALGCWLGDESSLRILGEDFHSRTMAIHGAFHEIAGEVVVSLNQQDPPEVTHALVDALKDLSAGLIEFLEFAKRQIEGVRHDWHLYPRK